MVAEEAAVEATAAVVEEVAVAGDRVVAAAKAEVAEAAAVALAAAREEAAEEPAVGREWGAFRRTVYSETRHFRSRVRSCLRFRRQRR